MSLVDIRKGLQKHRGLLSGIGMVFLVALIFWAVSSPAIVGVAASQRKLPIYSAQRDDKAVAISFDAAWGDVRVRQ